MLSLLSSPLPLFLSPFLPFDNVSLQLLRYELPLDAGMAFYYQKTHTLYRKKEKRKSKKEKNMSVSIRFRQNGMFS